MPSLQTAPRPGHDSAASGGADAANRYAHELGAFHVHAAVYAAGMTVIFVVNLVTNAAAGIARDWRAWWSLWALIGWGLGVAVHGLVVWLNRPTQPRLPRMTLRGDGGGRHGAPRLPPVNRATAVEHQGAAMTNWEYKIIDSKNIEGVGRVKGPTQHDAEEYLNELGADEWEVLHIDWRELERRMSFTGVAKRPRRNS